MKIPLSQLRLPEKDLRATIDPESIEELADSLTTRRQLQSIGVRPLDWALYNSPYDPDDDHVNSAYIEAGGTCEVVFGSRRYRAALLNEWTHLKAEFVNDADDENTAADKLIENVQREALTPIEEGYGLLELIGDDEVNLRKLHKQTGKSRDWIRNRLELVTMPDDLQQAVQRGLLGVGVAKAFATIQNDDLRAQYIEYAAENNMTAETARRYADMVDAAETGISTMVEHEEQRAADRAAMPYVPQQWTCFGCLQQRAQTECSQPTICRTCLSTISRGRIDQ